MNRMLRGSVVLAAAIGLVTCKGDPTDSLRNGVDRLVADPSALWIPEGSTETFDVEALDAQGNQLAADFTLGASPAGVTVAEDPSFNRVYDANGNLVAQGKPTKVRYTATATATVDATVTVTAGGKSVDVRIRVTPVALNSTITNPTPAIGEVVTLTAPAGIVFDATSVVSFTPGGDAVVTNVAADGSTISFIPIPGSQGPATVSNITLAYAPTLGTFTLTTTDQLTVPAVASIPANFSNSTPNQNDLVTVTAPGFKFLPNVYVEYNNERPVITAVAADSSSFTFRATKAGASGTITIGNTVLDFLTSVGLAVPAVNTITVGAGITPYAGTDAIATAPVLTIPATGKTLTVRDAGAFVGGPECANVIGGPCFYYTFTLTASTTFGVSATWSNLADLGIYFMTSDGSGLVGNFNCDAHGAGASSQPEVCTETLAAGTYVIAVDTFAAFYGPPNNVDPTDFTMVITGQ